jgi:hypothetical protein
VDEFVILTMLNVPNIQMMHDIHPISNPKITTLENMEYQTFYSLLSINYLKEEPSR